MGILLNKTETMGWEHAIRGMRNPMNSWELSDSHWHNGKYVIGAKDFDLMKRLVKAGTDHSKFMRMITVYVDITAPLYWWKEFDTYKVGTIANSCSTMHKIMAKPFNVMDFSMERIADPMDAEIIVNRLESYRYDFVHYEEYCERCEKMGFEIVDRKTLWETVIQLLPSSFNQKRTVELNYAVLQNIYTSRKNHKLKEWNDLCEWVETLPYSELITGAFE